MVESIDRKRELDRHLVVLGRVIGVVFAIVAVYMELMAVDVSNDGDLGDVFPFTLLKDDRTIASEGTHGLEATSLAALGIPLTFLSLVMLFCANSLDRRIKSESKQVI